MTLTLDDYTSADASMRSCLDLARVAARTELPVLVLGESGTGKTLLAHAIHNSSPRAASPFVSFNAAALSDTLLDSQLFGHERGAFTGADKRVKGKFELAHRGTLFIDEIADMSAVAQAKILRAVEYGEFERLGSETLQVASVRLISATYLPLRRYMRSEHFRQDLFYRISGISVHVPPLRDRPEDLRALVAAEIARACQDQGKRIEGISRAAAERLFAHHWPGNLRELKRVIQTAVALTTGDVILADAVLLEPTHDQDEPAVAWPAARSSAAAQGTHGSRAVERPTDRSVQPSDDLRLRTVEERHIQRVLEMTGGNKRRAARLLGLSRSTLDRKLAGRPAPPADVGLSPGSTVPARP
jgi:transcriptional regulator with PAS, ATPase and Fis domain